VVRLRDALHIEQVKPRDYVVEAGVVGVAQHALVVPDNGLCLVGAELCDLFCSGGDAVVTPGGSDIAAAEEESLDLSGGSERDGGAVETVVEGGVGDEG